MAHQSPDSSNWFVLAELHQSPVDLLSDVSCSVVAHQPPDSSNWFVLAELHQSPVDLLSISTSPPVPTSESQFKLRLYNSKRDCVTRT